MAENKLSKYRFNTNKDLKVKTKFYREYMFISKESEIRSRKILLIFAIIFSIIGLLYAIWLINTNPLGSGIFIGLCMAMIVSLYHLAKTIKNFDELYKTAYSVENK